MMMLINDKNNNTIITLQQKISIKIRQEGEMCVCKIELLPCLFYLLANSRVECKSDFSFSSMFRTLHMQRKV